MPRALWVRGRRGRGSIAAAFLFSLFLPATPPSDSLAAVTGWMETALTDTVILSVFFPFLFVEVKNSLASDCRLD